MVVAQPARVHDKIFISLLVTSSMNTERLTELKLLGPWWVEVYILPHSTMVCTLYFVLE